MTPNDSNNQGECVHVSLCGSLTFLFQCLLVKDPLVNLFAPVVNYSDTHGDCCLVVSESCRVYDYYTSVIVLSGALGEAHSRYTIRTTETFISCLALVTIQHLHKTKI